MAMKLIVALTCTMVVVAAVPLPNIRSAHFCSGWSPLGTDFVSDESPYDYYCSPSSDRRSLTMRVIARDPETAYKYLVMSAVDENGDSLIEGEYKLDTRLRTLTCDDKSRRVLKVDEEKVRDIIATYHLPEDKEKTLENINCRFAVATSLESYYSDVTINFFGDKVEAQEMQNDTVTIREEEPRIDEPVIAPRVDELAAEGTTSNDTAFTTNSTDQFETSSNQEVTQEQPIDTTAATGTTAVTGEEEMDTTDGELDHFVPAGTVDETDDLQQKFENEEKLGKETADKDTTLTLAAPDVPEEKEEFKNEGQEETFEAEFIMDEFGIQRQVIRENEKKLIYKGQSTGYWCESFGNTYVMAPGSDCKMFYQTIMQEGDLEVIPLASFNCAPGTRFNANPGKCICVSYDAMVCPDTSSAEVKSTTSKPETSPILDGTDDSSFNSTETFQPVIEPSPTHFNQTSQF